MTSAQVAYTIEDNAYSHFHLSDPLSTLNHVSISPGETLKGCHVSDAQWTVKRWVPPGTRSDRKHQKRRHPFDVGEKQQVREDEVIVVGCCHLSDFLIDRYRLALLPRILSFSLLANYPIMRFFASTFVALAYLTSSVLGSTSAPRGTLWGVVPRGGGAYEEQLEAAQTQVIQKASESIDGLRETIISQGKVVADLGSQAEAICTKALQDFAEKAPSADGSAAYDRSLEQLEASLDAPLQVLYLKQLSLLRQAALEQYRSATASAGGVADYEAMLSADSQFVAAAEASTRPGSAWDYATERSFLQAVMNNLAESGRQATQVKLNSAQQQQTAMQFLQSQQQMIQQLQMQLYGQQSPWNVGVAYRIPDTNFNLQGSYQQGKANVQLSCVPDEYAPFLGPNGFTNGVGPGNLGLSLNLSV